jgi:hypothetical protein
LIPKEENLERAGGTIPPGACIATHPHLEEFDRTYITEYLEEVLMRHPVDTHAHSVINYVGKQRMVEEAHENNPYEKPKDLGLTIDFGMSFIPTFMPQ